MKNRIHLQEKMFLQASDHDIFEQAKAYAYEYMDGVYERRVYPGEESLANLAVFDEPLPEDPGDSSEMLRLLHQYGSPAAVAHTGGRYFGMVVGSVFPPVMAAKWLADTWDQLSALYITSPIIAVLEKISERWLVELFGLPRETVVGFVSGTSSAIQCGLAAGRHEILKRAGWDVNNKGLFGAPPFRVVLGAEAHSTVFKALAFLGLGKERVETVPVDEQGRMIASKVPELDDNTLLILQAGNVNSGSFDPLDEICDKANQAGTWVHIDGAFGLWAAASESKRHLVHGIEKADSWSVDGHKTLNTPYDCGMVLCKHPGALVSALQATGSYILYGEQRDGMLYTPEMSRRGRAVEVWATLKCIGRRGLDELVECLCQRADQAARELCDNGFHILNDVVFNQVLVTCDTPEVTLATAKSLQQAGECWCGTAQWHDTPVIRMSVCSWATTERDISRAVSAFVKARESVIKQ